MQTVINDGFMNPDRFGYAVIPFQISDKEPRKDISKNVISRSNARSMGKAMYVHTKSCKACDSNLRRVYNNSCYDCWKKSKKPL